ncbi:ComF family protein [Candidatus Bipolaricaulota bacterium]|nr:ComF family protein [Candidatus Bipolaricaulota bacterium]
MGIICSCCEAALPSLAESRCQRCGEPLDDPSIDLCLRCGVSVHATDRIIVLGPYRGSWGALVRIFKFEKEVAVGNWLGRQMAATLMRQQELHHFDAVTYVPMTRKDRRARGFNQAEILARVIARQLDLPLKRLLTKSRNTRLQSQLTAAQRKTNLQDAFRLLPFDCERVLLVDDIFTTGSTIEECARTLKRGGAQTVVAAAIARA